MLVVETRDEMGLVRIFFPLEMWREGAPLLDEPRKRSSGSPFLLGRHVHGMMTVYPDFRSFRLFSASVIDKSSFSKSIKT